MIFTKIKDATQKDTIVLKIVSGEEVMARFVSIDEDKKTVTISCPQMVIPQMLNEKELGIQLVPWIISDLDVDLTVNLAHVVTSFIINNDISQKYIKNTTNIILM